MPECSSKAAPAYSRSQGWREAARVVPVVMEMTFRQTVLDGFVLFTVFVQPMIVALLGLWMLRDKGPQYGIYVVVGSGMTGLWSSMLFISGNSINVERWSGTLETVAGVPTSLAVIVFGKSLAGVLQALGSMVLNYLLASLLFGYPLVVRMPLLFTLSIALTVLAFICFALVIAPLFMLNPQVQQFQNGLEFPVYTLSGFLFPVALLPNWTTPLSWLLPTYWAARALHASSSGTGTARDVFLSWAVIAGCCAAYLLACGRLFRTMLRRARRDATLNLE